MLKLFNTLTRKKEEFKPIKKGIVNMYTCGLTTYNYGHIGNFRSFIFADLLRRYLEYKGFKVKQVINITDVDDKTIKKSKEEKVSLKQLTKKYEDAFFEDIKILNIEKSNYYPKATDHIKEMIELINILLKEEFAYKAEDGIYYRISKFKDYGKLANIKSKELKSGARVNVDSYDKEDANDFALWKFYDKEDGDVFWDAKIGNEVLKGRPGWHIECSAMSMKYLGKTFDIHTGGIDLVFPHHQNEIAQSEAATGKKFVNYWLHNEWLLFDGKKMSKSLGNFYTLRDLLEKGYNPGSIRYLLLSTHYRQQLNFTFEGLEASKNAVDKIQDFYDKIKANGNDEVKGIVNETKKKFDEAMDDDLNISEALAVIFEFMNEINKLILSKKSVKLVKDLMNDFDKVLGILKEKGKLPDEIKKLIEQREKLRKEKKFKEADEAREEIKNRGYLIEDSDKGTMWKKII